MLLLCGRSITCSLWNEATCGKVNLLLLPLPPLLLLLLLLPLLLLLLLLLPLLLLLLLLHTLLKLELPENLDFDAAGKQYV